MPPADHKRRYKADDVRPCIDQDQSLIQGCLNDPAYRSAKYQSLHQADPPSGFDAVIPGSQLVQLLSQIVARFFYIIYYMVLLK